MTPSVTITGPWQVQIGAGQVEIGRKTVTVHPASVTIAQATEVTVTTEAYDTLPIFNAGAAGWSKGTRLRGVVTQETSAHGALFPDSVVVTSEVNGGATFLRDRDYALDPDWGTFGRLAGGGISDHTPVYVSYRYGLGRIDSLVLDRHGRVSIHPGLPAPNPSGDGVAHLPQPPPIAANEARLANIWVSPRLEKLTDDNLFPILETAYPEGPQPSSTIAEQWLPNTLRKLRSGEPLKILAWGDSVTDGGFLPSPGDRWQEQFVKRLQGRFPKANINLVTNAWGGRNSQNFLDEPAGSPHNYAETVIGAKPDLVVSEFVNDAGLSPGEVETRYGKFLSDFEKIGAEWIILTPHYVRPDWMGLTRVKDIDQDPRPYVTGLRQFSTAHHIALADASLRWGRLWRQGIPYPTLLGNSINHPDPRGQMIFVDSLMVLFPGKDSAK